MGNVQCQTKRSTGISLPALPLPPKCNNPQTGNTSLSQSAGAVWGDMHGPLHFLASALYFMPDERNYPEPKKISFSGQGILFK
jgi:hypothetical protein